MGVEVQPCRRGDRRRAGEVFVAVVGALALLVGVLASTVAGAGQAEAATVTGTIANYAGGCLENANNSTATNNPQQLNYCGTNAGQQWSRYSDGTIRVQGKCIDTLNGGTGKAPGSCSSSARRRPPRRNGRSSRAAWCRTRSRGPAWRR